MNNNFLNSVHKKISKKKKINGLRNLVLLVGFTSLVSIQSALLILNSHYEKAWVEFGRSESEYYIWEEIVDIEDYQAFSYVIEDMELYEVFLEFKETLNEIELNKIDKMKG
jgi:hypothetical protein